MGAWQTLSRVCCCWGLLLTPARGCAQQHRQPRTLSKPCTMEWSSKGRGQMGAELQGLCAGIKYRWRGLWPGLVQQPAE